MNVAKEVALVEPIKVSVLEVMPIGPMRDWTRETPEWGLYMRFGKCGVPEDLNITK